MTAFSEAQQLAPVHAYVHIPFCLRKCPYCDFCSYPLEGAELSPAVYQDLLRQEIRQTLAASCRRAGGLRPLETVYFGGGTPTAPAVSLITESLALLRERCALTAGAEISVEMNPGATDEAKLLALREAGVNRLSIGLQSADDAMLKKIGRIHDRADFERLFKAARALGFGNINVDLMLALPGQSLADVEAELDYILQPALRPEHLAVYSLIIEEGTAFAERYAAGEPPLPSDAEERAMYHLVRKRLNAAGLRPYEISNQARPGYESRHNLAYWDGEHYYGFGAGASSYMFAERRTNPCSLRAYERQVRSGEAAEPEEIIDAAEGRKEFFIFRLRKAEGFAQEEYRALFGSGWGEEVTEILEKYRLAGLLLHEEGRWFCSERGLDFADEVARAFI